MSPGKCPHCNEELPPPLDDSTKLAVLGYIRNWVLGVGGVGLAGLVAFATLLQSTVTEGFKAAKKSVAIAKQLEETKETVDEQVAAINRKVGSISQRSEAADRDLKKIAEASRKITKDAEGAEKAATQAKSEVEAVKAQWDKATELVAVLKTMGDVGARVTRVLEGEVGEQLVKKENFNTVVTSLATKSDLSDLESVVRKAGDDRESIRSDIRRKVILLESAIAEAREFAKKRMKEHRATPHPK